MIRFKTEESTWAIILKYYNGFSDYVLPFLSTSWEDISLIRDEIIKRIHNSLYYNTSDNCIIRDTSTNRVICGLFIWNINIVKTWPTLTNDSPLHEEIIQALYQELLEC